MKKNIPEVNNKKRLPKRKHRPVLLPGMKDVLAQEQTYWEYILEMATQTSRAYGYQRLEVPMVEEEQLYVRALGKDCPLITKEELFSWKTKQEEKLALRPEFTAGIVRAYIEHGMINLPQPLKFWTNGPLYRNEPSQAGRYRQFNQIDWEIIGSPHPAIEAELISLAYHLLTDLGLEVMVKVNSIGMAEDRKEYINALKDYLRPHRKNIDALSQELYTKDPLRILASKDVNTKEILKQAPQLVDFLSDESRDHFMRTLEYLDAGDIVYHLDPFLVKSFGYYSHTLFELILRKDAEELDPMSLVSGGHYHNLVHDLGGTEETTGAGMGFGLERVVLAMKEAGITPGAVIAPEVFLAQIGETARKHSLQLLEELRAEGIPVISNVSKNGLADQLSLANKSTVKITLILGQKEMIDKTIIVRDMENGSQESVMQTKLMATLKRYLKK